MVALLQIVAISLVDNPRVDIYIGLQLCMDTRQIAANPPHPEYTCIYSQKKIFTLSLNIFPLGKCLFIILSFSCNIYVYKIH